MYKLSLYLLINKSFNLLMEIIIFELYYDVSTYLINKI